MEGYIPCPKCDNVITVRPIREKGEIDGICSNDLASYCQYCQKHYEFSFDELEVYKKSLKEVPNENTED